MTLNPNLFGIGLVAVGVTWFALWARSILKGIRSRYWMNGKGIVKKIEDHSFSYTRPSQYSGSVAARYNRKSYQIEYEVEGARFMTTSIRFGALIDTQAQGIREGQRVAIKINPQNHEEAVVKSGVPLTAWIGLIPLAIGIYTMLQ